MHSNNICYIHQLIFYQVIQISSMSVVSVMTTVPIATQTPMVSIFPQGSCHVFWTAIQIYNWNLVTSGIGMAIYRLLGFHFLFKRNLNTKKVVRNILIAQLIVSASMISVKAEGFNKFGWEKAIHYQDCMDMGWEQVHNLHDYDNQDFNSLMYKTLRFAPLMTGQTLILGELVIYLWIIYHLWNHDKKNFQDKIITNHMRKERNQKNIITLKGQVCTFLIEFAFTIYISIHARNFALVDPSAMAISLTICSTTISVVQILSSHEMMRFIRSHFNLF